MYETLTKRNYMMFALRYYDNPHCGSEEEFHEDMEVFKHINRLLKKYNDKRILKNRLLLNHFIKVRNIFQSEAAVPLLLFSVNKKYFSQMKSVLIYLNMIRDDELAVIPEDKEFYQKLGAL